MSEVLKVELRQSRGKRHAKRLRIAGSVPAVLYGHGEANLSLQAQAEQVRSIVRHGARVVDLQGAVSEKAFIRALQWDTYGVDVLHLDLTRVSADEKVQVMVSVDLRGEAPGVKDGGVVSQLLHQVKIECLAIAIPEKLNLSVNGLRLGDSLTVGNIELPEGTTMLTDSETLVVQCVEPKAEEDLAAPLAEGAEPEVIGRKEEEEESDESNK
ncbi:MAG TPA: 50S ribosomal protein L25 [Pirellulales bacterium]|nr:50S ribosomal protein L25 [Pirellulales bacterium]